MRASMPRRDTRGKLVRCRHAKCTNDATEEKKKNDELATCDDCIGDKSCTSATFNCASECAPFVP